MLLHAHKIKVPAAIGDLFSTLHGAVIDGAEAEPWGQGEALLGRGKEQVDAPGIHFDLCAAQRRDSVDTDHRFGAELVNNLGDLFDRVLHAGGGFIVNDGDHIVFFFLDGFGNHCGENRLSPGDLHFIGLLAIGSGDLMPALGKRPVDAAEHTILSQVPHSCLLAAGARSRQDEDPVLCGKELARLISSSLEDGFKIFTAVRHHRLSLGCQHSRIDIDRTGDKHR